MSHRTVKTLGVFVYSEGGTEYDWTSRALGDEFTSVSETMEEDVLQFVHSDIRVTLDDADGVVSGLLMGLSATAKWRCEIWRDPSNWAQLWAGLIDPLSIVQDYGNKTVSFDAYSYSKLLDINSAEDIKRVPTGITVNTTINTVNGVFSDGTLFEVDDEIEVSQSGFKEKRRIASKSGNNFTVTEEWSSQWFNATVDLNTPYYRNKLPDFLVGKILDKAGITSKQIRLDALSISDPFPDRMNSNGLSRRLVDCVTTRGTSPNNRIVAFENLSSFYATSPTSGFVSGSYTPLQPTDWTAYASTEPASFLNIEYPDVGKNVCGNQTVAYWYLVEEITGTTTRVLTLKLKRSSDSAVVTIYSFNYNSEFYEGDGYWETGLEYNQTESRIWVTYKAFLPDGSLKSQGCTAVNGTSMAKDGTRPPLGGSSLRFNINGPHMIEFGTNYINVRGSATPYSTAYVLEYRSGLQPWTMRRITFDFNSYWCCVQRRDSGVFGKTWWYLILWDYYTGAIVSETKISAGYALNRSFGSVWYDSANARYVYIGYVEMEESGGQYFYLTKSLGNIIAYADFEKKSCSDAMLELAKATGSVFKVDRGKTAYFIGRNSLAAQFSASPLTITDPIQKRKRRFWEWYRTSCVVSGQDPVSGSSVEELVGDTGNTQHRLSVDSEYVSTPGLARALANNYVSFLSNTRGELNVVVFEPTAGPVELFHRVTLDGTIYRVYKVENDYATGEQALTLVQE